MERIYIISEFDNMGITIVEVVMILTMHIQWDIPLVDSKWHIDCIKQQCKVSRLKIKNY